MRTITGPFCNGRKHDSTVVALPGEIPGRCRFVHCQSDMLLNDTDLRYNLLMPDGTADELEIGWVCDHCEHFAKLVVLSDPYLESVRSMVALALKSKWYGSGIPFGEAALVRVFNEWTASPEYKKGDPRPRLWYKAIQEAEVLGMDIDAMVYLHEHNPAATNREILRLAAALKRANA